MARHLCEEFLGHGGYDSTLEEAKVGLQSQRHHAIFYPHAPTLGNMDVTSNMLGSSIEGGEPTVNCSHGSHGDKDYEHPSSEHDYGATTLVIRAASEGAILKMTSTALSAPGIPRRSLSLRAPFSGLAPLGGKGPYDPWPLGQNSMNGQ